MARVKIEAEPLRRTERKRRDIITRATALFLRNGFRGTSMDEVAAAAKVSKQTVYKQFRDKQSLFREIVEGVTANSEAIVASIDEAFGQEPAVTLTELQQRLTRVARTYLDGVLDPGVLSLRRLIIGAVDQFPDLAEAYYTKAQARGIDVIEKNLRPYVATGVLRADDLRLAATHFAYLALSPAQDRAMFLPAKPPTARERERLSSSAARAFVAAYGSGAALPDLLGTDRGA